MIQIFCDLKTKDCSQEKLCSFLLRHFKTCCRVVILIPLNHDILGYSPADKMLCPHNFGLIVEYFEEFAMDYEWCPTQLKTGYMNASSLTKHQKPNEMII